MTDEQAIEIVESMFKGIQIARGSGKTTEQLMGILALGRVIALAKEQAEINKNKGD